MNIFVVDIDPSKAAQSLCDKHVVKMVLETAQILSTISGGPYRPTHANHPCVLWAGATKRNYLWLVEHGWALCQEYTHRYGKVHKCQGVIESLRNPPATITRTGLTPFVQCMPEEYRGPNAVEAYRRYYRADKSQFATWKTQPPSWWVR